MKEKILVVNKKFRPACFRQYYCEKTCKKCPWKKKCNNSKKKINSFYGEALWKSLTENKNSSSIIPEKTFIKYEDDYGNMSGVICKCGYGMVFNRVIVYSDSLNGNIFCDVEFVCSECEEIKYLRCPAEKVLKAKRKEDYHPCLERREILFEG